MKDFCEAVLTLTVKGNVAEVYKKAIETENYPNGLRDHWNGVYASVTISPGTTVYSYSDAVVEVEDAELTIQLLSHTAKSLKQVVDWYERVGCKVIRTDYKGAKV
ncbi:hypothetical protein ABQD61_06930 [Enterococcus asini]|uniref:hypothetical protein n=1 Tax=Enterococcus asini TaxID=57732 RepID=UPI0032E39C2D